MNTQAPAVGELTEYEPGVAMVLAPNASPMTYWGTNTWLIGETRLAVLDPGPMDEDHLAALLKAIDGRPVDYVLVSHAHVDHSPLAHPLAREINAPVYAFGPATAGQKPHMQALAASGLAGGGEGIDTAFTPDRALKDGDTLDIDGRTLTALHTPGHMSNHLCFAMDDIVFTADHVMGWASSLVSPPDGDLTEFMKSCDTLGARRDRIYYPGHGAPIENPLERITWLTEHRHSRESQIIDALRDGPANAPTLTKRIYTDVNPALLPAAERNVLAHLIDLAQRGLAKPQGDLAAEVKFQPI